MKRVCLCLTDKSKQTANETKVFYREMHTIWHIVLLLVVRERTRMTQSVAQVDSGRNADDSVCSTPSEVPILIFGQGEKLSALSERGPAPGR